MERRLAYVYNHFTDHGFISTLRLISTKLKLLMKRRQQFQCGDTKDIIHARFSDCVPLAVYTLPRHDSCARITLITDSINSGSFYGGVGTAIIFAALLAESRKARLRIVTRTERGQPENVGHLLAAQHIRLSHEIEFVFSPPLISNREIDIFDDELFITTSWWTTAATKASVRPESIIYLLQEDERMFYPYGDQHMRCTDVLKSENIQFVVNTQLLFQYLVEQGFDNIARNGTFFEPAFPREVFKRQQKSAGSKLNMMFYARPNNPRNLFYFGLELIDAAIERGIIDLNQWDIIFVGKDIPKIIFNNGYAPTKRENLQWTEYGALIGDMDLGLSLMYTPHPSYPPLDLAAGGAIAVTNRYANKRDLSGYSKNILCGDLDKESMLVTLKQGMQLAVNNNVRKENAQTSALLSDWCVALSDVVKHHSRVLQ